MADTEAEKYTFEQRKAGGEKLAAALTEAGIKNELLAERGRTENYDSVRVRVSDKNGVAAGDLAINAKGYINVSVVYTDGERRALDKACDVAEELQGSEVKDGFAKKKAKPGGESFLGKL